jgi:hypothetical protein
VHWEAVAETNQSWLVWWMMKKRRRKMMTAKTEMEKEMVLRSRECAKEDSVEK